MPSRRAFLGGVSALALAGCLEHDGWGSDPTTTDPTTTDPETPSQVTLDRSSPERVPGGSTVGLLPPTFASLDSAVSDAPTEVSYDPLWETVEPFGCFEFDGQTYTIKEVSRGGGYQNDYDVHEVDEPTDETVVSAADLPDDERDEVVDAIEAGEYTFDSTEGGYRPNGSVVAYEDDFYAFEQTRHADFPVELVFVVEESAGGECVTTSRIELDDTQIEAIEAVPDGDPTVLAVTAGALRDAGFDYVLVEAGCYRVPPASLLAVGHHA